MNAPSAIPQVEHFLNVLESKGLLSKHAAQRALNAIHSSNHAFDTVMTELGLIGEQDLARHLSEFLDVPFDEQALEPDENGIGSISLEYLRDNAVLPLRFEERHFTVAVADPFSSAAVDAVAFHYEKIPSLRVLPRRLITDCIDRLQASSKGAQLSKQSPETETFGPDDLERLKDFARAAPIVRFVADVIHRAVDAKATDIHIEPLEDHVRIRFRNDGILSNEDTASSAMLAGISTRIKILARLNIAERRLPQDGRMRMSVRGRDIDMRVSVIPSIHGESIVLRILDRTSIALQLDKLGFDNDAQAWIRNISSAANGIVLITGPTGSGKTTTLYSILSERAKPDVKIFTVEDPVEYRLAGVSQLQVNSAIDLDFATALRSILRQDPDIILVGEIRDRETAQIAIQAALTGHLVFSTLHTNSAAGALTRLRDIGLDGYLLGATIRGVIAQRLLRRVCTTCEGKVSAAKDEYPDFHCPACRNSGYSGRTVTYELLKVSPSIAALIDARANEMEIERAAKLEGLVPMGTHAGLLATAGMTTADEVRRVIDLGGSE